MRAGGQEQARGRFPQQQQTVVRLHTTRTSPRLLRRVTRGAPAKPALSHSASDSRSFCVVGWRNQSTSVQAIGPWTELSFECGISCQVVQAVREASDLAKGGYRGPFNDFVASRERSTTHPQHDVFVILGLVPLGGALVQSLLCTQAVGWQEQDRERVRF